MKTITFKISNAAYIQFIKTLRPVDTETCDHSRVATRLEHYGDGHSFYIKRCTNCDYRIDMSLSR